MPPPNYRQKSSRSVSAEVVQALMAVLPTHCLLYREEDTTPYECDGLRRLPAATARGCVA